MVPALGRRPPTTTATSGRTGPAPGFVPSPGPAPGYYLKNFYDSQPALNFGYAPAGPGRALARAGRRPRTAANRQALRDIIAFWLDRGVSGFRVDMAYSLVKDDPGFAETAALWQEISGWMHDAYPDSVLLPESESRAPADIGVRGGFDADFFLVIHAAHSALFNNGGAGTLAWLPGHERCYFDADGQRRRRPRDVPDGSGTSTTPAAGAGPAGRARPRPTTTTPGSRPAPGRRSSSASPSRSC